jgi:hypothetical protein
MPEAGEARPEPAVGAREQREQIEQVPRSLEETVALNHPARAI